MDKNKNVFIYVACGSDEHISKLNLSIRLLKKFTINTIIVLTDSKRNETKINHDNIIDIDTPKELDNHQASIFLKTGVYKYVDLEHNYCYLDTDVLALNNNADEVFYHFIPPITFARDHCKLDEFSGYAFNCGCLEKKLTKRNRFFEIQNKIAPEFSIENMFISQKARELFCNLYDIKNYPFSNLSVIFRYILQKYILPYKYFYLNQNFRFDKKRRIWIDKDNNSVMRDILAYNSGFYKEIEKSTGFSFDLIRRIWKDESGQDFFYMKCHHLHEEIEIKFQQRIRPYNWQHWNGGVFLFNRNSKDFLETWHKFSLSTFDDANWKTRDQGTLAATTWKFGLQNMSTLSTEFNFLADFYKPEVSYKEGFGFTIDNFKTTFHPCLIHIYHHFGNRNWNIWQHIEDLCNS